MSVKYFKGKLILNKKTKKNLSTAFNYVILLLPTNWRALLPINTEMYIARKPWKLTVIVLILALLTKSDCKQLLPIDLSIIYYLSQENYSIFINFYYFYAYFEKVVYKYRSVRVSRVEQFQVLEELKLAGRRKTHNYCETSLVKL